MNKKIKYQLDSIKYLNLDKLDKELRIKITAANGIYEEIGVSNSGIDLDCTMAWNKGSLYYDLPANELYKLLESKPFSEIRSDDLINYENELFEVSDGNLECKAINGIEISQTDKIVDILKDTIYEIELDNEEEELNTLISDQMYDLYQRGDIYNSEYNFNGLFSLEIVDFDFSDLTEFSIDHNYWDSIYNSMNIEFENKYYENSIESAKKYLQWELEKNIYEIDDMKSIKNNILDCFEIISKSYENLKDYDSAIENYLICIYIDSESHLNLAHLANCYLNQNKYQEAEKYFRSAVDINPNYIWAFSQYADCFEQQEKYSDELDILNEGIEKNQSQPSGHLSIVWLYRQKGNNLFLQKKWGESIESYLTAIEIEDDSAIAHLRLGFSYFNQAEYQKSYDSFVQCQQMNDNFKDANIFYHKGECMRLLNKFELAVAEYNQCVEKNDDTYFPWAQKMLGNSYLELKQFSKSVECFNKSIEDKWTFQNKGKAFFGLNKFEDAINCFEKVIEIDSDYKWAYQEKGKSHFLLKQYENSIDCFKQVIELDINYKWAYHWLGDSLFEIEDYNNSLVTYQKLIEIDEEYPYDNTTAHILSNMALIFHQNENYEKAKYYYELCDGRIYKDKLWYYYFRFLADKNSKGTFFTSPLKIKQINDEVISEVNDKATLSYIYMSRGKQKIWFTDGENLGKQNLKQSYNDLNESIILNPENFEAYYHRANCLSGNFSNIEDLIKKDKLIIDNKNAINDLLECLKIQKYLPAYKLLISLYSDISDIQNLKKISDESMKEFTNDFELYTTIASACKKNSLLNETVFAYKKAIGLNNKSTRIYQYLGQVYLELGDSKNAINSFKECISIDSDNELYNWLLSKAYLLDSQIDKAKEQINIAIKSYSGDKNYFIQYAEICGEIYKDTYPELEKLMINYIDETKLYNGRSEEIKNKIFEFLEKCDSSSNNEIILFELWEYFNDSDILYFLKEGSDNVKYHLSKNKSLTSEQLNLLTIDMKNTYIFEDYPVKLCLEDLNENKNNLKNQFIAKYPELEERFEIINGELMFLISETSEISQRNWAVDFLESNANGERPYNGLGVTLSEEIYKELYHLFLDSGNIFFASSSDKCIVETIGIFDSRCSFKLKEDGLHWNIEEED